MAANFFNFFFLFAFALMAVCYFWQLIKCWAFGHRTKRTYHALWILPCSMIFLKPVLPVSYFPLTQNDSDLTLLILWTLSLICVIIFLFYPIKDSQKWIWEVVMGQVISCVDRCKHLLLSFGEIYAQTPRWFQIILDLLLFILFLLAGIFAPEYAPFLILVYWIISFFCSLHRCIFSCKALVIFWLGRALISAILLSIFLVNAVPANLIKIPLLYCIICVLLTALWCFSAGIVEYDVARMAGAIINTFTTILLVAVNILFGWLQRDSKLTLGVNIKDLFAEIIYVINLIVFPVVMSGYLAVLFADGLEYWKKRHTHPISKDLEPEPEDDMENLIKK